MQHPARKYLGIWLLPVLVLAAAVFYRLCRPVADRLLSLYHCPIHAITGLYCPGCGGTRSLKAVLSGHFLLALHENPPAMLLLLAAVLLYVERILAACGKPVKLVPRRLAFWYVVIGLVLVWAILRNFIPALMPVT